MQTQHSSQLRSLPVHQKKPSDYQVKPYDLRCSCATDAHLEKYPEGRHHFLMHTIVCYASTEGGDFTYSFNYLAVSWPHFKHLPNTSKLLCNL